MTEIKSLALTVATAVGAGAREVTTVVAFLVVVGAAVDALLLIPKPNVDSVLVTAEVVVVVSVVADVVVCARAGVDTSTPCITDSSSSSTRVGTLPFGGGSTLSSVTSPIASRASRSSFPSPRKSGTDSICAGARVSGGNFG